MAKRYAKYSTTSEDILILQFASLFSKIKGVRRHCDTNFFTNLLQFYRGVIFSTGMTRMEIVRQSLIPFDQLYGK